MALHDITLLIAFAAIGFLFILACVSLVMGFKDNADYKKWVRDENNTTSLR